MKRVVEVVTKKQADMKRQEEEKKKLQISTDKLAPTDKTTNKAWYKFW